MVSLAGQLEWVLRSGMDSSDQRMIELLLLQGRWARLVLVLRLLFGPLADLASLRNAEARIAAGCTARTLRIYRTVRYSAGSWSAEQVVAGTATGSVLELQVSAFVGSCAPCC